jgi:hypothetical protein
LAQYDAYPECPQLDLSHQFKDWRAGLVLKGRPYPIQAKQWEALLERYGAAARQF